MINSPHSALRIGCKENYIVDMVSTEFLNLQIDNHLHWKYHIQQMTPKLQGGADKSLAQPGRKQATVTKLRIYSTYSSRSSIHFLACCSNLCKPLKKKFRRLSVQPSLRDSKDLRVGTEMATFQLCFQSREQVVVQRGHIQKTWWVIKTLKVQVGQFLLGCKYPVSRGIVVQEQDPLGDLPMAFFLQNVLQLHQQRWVILRVDSLVLWKIISEANAVLIPKNQGENFSSGFLHSEFFGVGWAAMPPLRVTVI